MAGCKSWAGREQHLHPATPAWAEGDAQLACSLAERKRWGLGFQHWDPCASSTLRPSAGALTCPGLSLAQPRVLPAAGRDQPSMGQCPERCQVSFLESQRGQGPGQLPLAPQPCSGQRPVEAQAGVPHLLLVDPVEEGVLQGCEVVPPVAHDPCEGGERRG